MTSIGLLKSACADGRVRAARGETGERTVATRSTPRMARRPKTTRVDLKGFAEERKVFSPIDWEGASVAPSSSTQRIK